MSLKQKTPLSIWIAGLGRNSGRVSSDRFEFDIFRSGIYLGLKTLSRKIMQIANITMHPVTDRITEMRDFYQAPRIIRQERAEDCGQTCKNNANMASQLYRKPVMPLAKRMPGKEGFAAIGGGKKGQLRRYWKRKFC